MRSNPLRKFAPFAALAALLFAATSARAQDSFGNDEVTLKNGGSIRGTVVSSEPGKDVTIIELGHRDPRVIPWDEVGGVVRGRFSTALPPPPPEPELVPNVPGVVRLHITTPAPVALFKHRDAYGQTARGTAFQLDNSRMLCKAPCDLVIDGRLDREFSVAGTNAVESGRFQLGALSGDQTLVVSPGNPTLRSAGGSVIAAGGIAIGLGIVGAIIGAVGTKPNPDGTGFVRNKGLETAGFATIGGGAGAIVGGVVMIIASRTTLDFHPTTASGQAKARWWAGEF